jgi:hypothetical protein
MMNTTMMILFGANPITDLRSAPDTKAYMGGGGKSWEECFFLFYTGGYNFFGEIIAKIIMQGQKLGGGERWDFFANSPTHTHTHTGITPHKFVHISCTHLQSNGGRAGVSDLGVFCRNIIGNQPRVFYTIFHVL